ncbi:branched-chain amino acid ABC transporter permease [Chelativorans sp. ZYF759]|uniref:branched-chain amino acid ABC transporter permease n=1 Tax=Chelativorans sp. ZYF759 TaxID=2692213 RepID=UPI00145CA822|nr:branched-chain amino acid ABC transporter permease [Chelativorans sp. ZYF759]NMG37618.1 branched-chain amino acid ABC transporter permease [Chelativorans sp. ZYF759]
MTRLTTEEIRIGVIGAVVVALVALLPFFDNGFYLSLTVNIMLYAALCTAWTLFSGPTHYVSLATAAFFGIGTYAVGLGIDHLPFPVLVGVGAVAAALLAGIVGAATLRISGVYFVVFTLGLAELVRQLVSWSQSKFTGRMGLYVFTDIREMHILWMLLALTVVVFLTGWLINRSRLGFAMEIIGNDETVAKHSGIDTARAKILLFMISGAFIGIAGAIMAPRYAYIQPPSAFNPMISFLVVIMALLGGTKRLWGPLVGVIPFTILMDIVSSRFPNHTYIVMGIAFLAIVYLLPNGVTGRLEQLRERLRHRQPKPEAVSEEKPA